MATAKKVAPKKAPVAQAKVEKQVTKKEQKLFGVLKNHKGTVSKRNGTGLFFEVKHGTTDMGSVEFHISNDGKVEVLSKGKFQVEVMGNRKATERRV